MRKPHILFPATLLAIAAFSAHADEGHGPAVNRGTGVADQYVSPARLATSTRSRDEVVAELAEARRAGNLPQGDLGRTESELRPQLAAGNVVAARTRADVQKELAEAIEAGDIADGDLGRTRREINPQRYAAVPKHGTAVAVSSRVSAPAISDATPR